VGAFQTTYQGGFYDATVLKLNAAGNVLVYSTYLGGNSEDNANAHARPLGHADRAADEHADGNPAWAELSALSTGGRPSSVTRSRSHAGIDLGAVGAIRPLFGDNFPTTPGYPYVVCLDATAPALWP
jgi:hypothetical protein